MCNLDKEVRRNTIPYMKGILIPVEIFAELAAMGEYVKSNEIISFLDALYQYASGKIDVEDALESIDSKMLKIMFTDAVDTINSGIESYARQIDKANKMVDARKNKAASKKTKSADKTADNVIKIKEKKTNTVKEKQTKADAIFEKLWSMIPRKQGKASVNNKNKVKLLDYTEDQLTNAVNAFNADMVDKDPQYIPMGSTFFNSRIFDYLDNANMTNTVNINTANNSSNTNNINNFNDVDSAFAFMN